MLSLGQPTPVIPTSNHSVYTAPSFNVSTSYPSSTIRDTSHLEIVVAKLPSITMDHNESTIFDLELPDPHRDLFHQTLSFPKFPELPAELSLQIWKIISRNQNPTDNQKPLPQRLYSAILFFSANAFSRSSESDGSTMVHSHTSTSMDSLSRHHPRHVVDQLVAPFLGRLSL